MRDGYDNHVLNYLRVKILDKSVVLVALDKGVEELENVQACSFLIILRSDEIEQQVHAPGERLDKVEDYD